MTFKHDMWVSKKPAFEKKIATLNKILKRHGKPLFKFRYEDERQETVTIREHIKGDAFANDEERTCVVTVCTVVIDGVIGFKKDDKDYRYIGSVKFASGVKQSYCTDHDYEWAFINFRDGICDHCGSKRMNRHAYYLFEAEGKVIQVGSTCAKEYFGINATRYLKCADETFVLINDESDERVKDGAGFSDDYGVSYGQIYKFLDFATMGFQKWTKAADGADPAYAQDIHDVATVEIVRGQISEFFGGRPVLEGNNPIQLSREECIAYWQNQPLTTFTDNIINALSADGVYPRTIGTYCYGIYGAVNAIVKEQMAKHEDTSKPCKYEVGKRVNLKGKVLSIKSYEVEDPYSYYGGMITKFTVNFKDEDNALYHFNTGSGTFSEVNEGDEIEIRAKILEAKEWKGVLYTGLHLPKVVHNLTKESESAA